MRQRDQETKIKTKGKTHHHTKDERQNTKTQKDKTNTKRLKTEDK